MAKTTEDKKPKKIALKVLGICGFALACAIFLVFLVNALLCVFMDHYYPTFGEYRLFAIVSDSMEGDAEDSISTGNMIVSRVPKSESEIKVGTIITYEFKQNGNIALITHRVIEINYNSDGKAVYTTRGDNADGIDSYRPSFEDVVGVFTGRQCGFFGYFFGFLQSPEGAITLIIIALIVALTWIIIHFVNLVNIWRNMALNALKKSAQMLNQMNNIEELGTLADVIGIVSKDPTGKTDIRRKDEKLNWFIEMSALPKRPYPDDLEEYLKMMGDSLKPVPVPRLKYADDDDALPPDERTAAQPENRQITMDEVIAAQEAVEAATEEVATEAVEEVTEEVTEAAVEEIATEAVEEAVEEAAEEVAEEAAEEAEQFIEEEAEQPITEEHLPITLEEVLSEAEAEESEAPVEEDTPDEAAPDEDEVQEEVRSLDKLAGIAVVVRYNKSFTAKLIQSDDRVKAYYSILKNALLSFGGIKSRISWSHENFNLGRSNVARFTVRGKSLCVYFALEPDDYADTKYRVERAESKRYASVPCMFRIKNARRCKYALDLIADLAEKQALTKGEEQNVNYYLRYEHTKPLIERGLIKELVSEEDYFEFMRVYSRKEVDRKRREFISVKEVNELISDDVAMALVEDKRNADVQKKPAGAGKKGIINVDALSERFKKGETVTLEKLKERGLVAKNVTSLKVLARGTLTKPLIVEAQDFSIEAIKMIVLTGGKATKV